MFIKICSTIETDNFILIQIYFLQMMNLFFLIIHFKLQIIRYPKNIDRSKTKF